MNVSSESSTSEGKENKREINMYVIHITLCNFLTFYAATSVGAGIVTTVLTPGRRRVFEILL